MDRVREKENDGGAQVSDEQVHECGLRRRRAGRSVETIVSYIILGGFM